MVDIKQGLNKMLRVKFNGVSNIFLSSEVYKIEFAFSQSKYGTPLKTAVFGEGADGTVFRVYPPDTLGRVYEDLLDIQWTAAETYLFRPESAFYMDTRITLKDGNDAAFENPKTKMIQLMMDPTLFAEEDDD